MKPAAAGNFFQLVLHPLASTTLRQVTRSEEEVVPGRQGVLAAKIKDHPTASSVEIEIHRQRWEIFFSVAKFCKKSRAFRDSSALP